MATPQHTWSIDSALQFRAMLTVSTGCCPTCGWPTYGELRGFEFWSREGWDLPTVTIDGTCGAPGHPIMHRAVTRHEFAAAPATNILR